MMTEMFDGGLVTSRIPSLLNPGELSSCIGAVYLPHSSSLWRPPGLTTLLTTSSGQFFGLEPAVFDNGNVYLISQKAGQFVRSAAGPASPLSNLGASTGAGDLVAVHRQDKYYLLNGADRTQVLRNDGTIRPAGMLPVTVGPGVTVTTVTDAWQEAHPGYFEYWTTEVAEIVENGSTTVLESEFTGSPATVFIVDDDKRVQIARPEVVNPLATKWRIYRSELKDVATDKLFPRGILVGEQAISTATFTDGVSSVTSYIFAATHDISQGTAWTNPGNVSSDDGVYATVVFSNPDPDGTFPALSGIERYKDFGFSGLTDPIVGIEVEIQAKSTDITYTTLSVGVSGDAGVSTPAYKTVTLAAGDTTTVLGGPTDLWGIGWTNESFTNTNFRLWLAAQTRKNGSTTVSVDYVKIRVYYGGAAAYNQVYPFIEVTINGVIAAVGEDGTPPVATTGCIFEDSFVTNDVAHPDHIRWSPPGKPESFPSIYLDDFETEQNDEVVYIGTIYTHLIVLCSTKAWRQHYLPSEEDAIFSRGVAREEIDAIHGCVGPRAACKYYGVGGRPTLAFVDRNGLFGTDGVNTWPLTEDLDWPNTIAQSKFSSCRLVNNPEKWELLLYYSVATGTPAGTELCLHFNYHPSHLKNGKLKVSGPVDRVTNWASTCIQATTGKSVVYNAMSLPAGTTGIFSDDDAVITASVLVRIATRDIYANGLGNEWILKNVYVHHQNAGSPQPTMQVGLSISKTNSGLSTPAAVEKTFVPNFDGFNKMSWASGIGVEGARFIFTEPANTGRKFIFDYIVINGGDQGAEDSKKTKP